MMQLPPQAYTKETLIQAYNWLRSQPPHIQELAKSPDTLVALYTKTLIHGENYLNRSNIQGFKTELKNLAQMMGELTETNGKPIPDGSTSPQGASHRSMAKVDHRAAPEKKAIEPSPTDTEIFSESPLEGTSVTNGASSPPMPAFRPNGMNSSHASGYQGVPDLHQMPLYNQVSTEVSKIDLKGVLDNRSWAMLQEVKNHFNLSSETEAVRLLIAMGYQKMRTQF